MDFRCCRPNGMEQMEATAQDAPQELERITVREREFIMLVCRFPEPTTAEIAEFMDLSPKTVETHRAKVYRKWEVGSTLDVYHKAVRLGLVKCACRGHAGSEAAQ